MSLAARCVSGVAALAAAAIVPVVVLAQGARQPVYVGARACARCHEGHAAGNQSSLWLLSAHSKAWATLATPEAKVMAQLSGIADDPEKAPVCLGCHATAAEAEAWERDPGFRVEDGVQCEKCHGPGSEYMAEDVMRDREKPRRAGLRVFSRARLRRLPLREGLARRRAPEPAARRRGRVDAARSPGAREPSGLHVSARGRSGTSGRTRAAVRGGRRVRCLPPGPEDGLPVQPVAAEPPRARLRQPLHAGRRAGREGDGRRRGPAGRAGLPEVPRDGRRTWAPVAETYDPMEGVGCEACHGVPREPRRGTSDEGRGTTTSAARDAALPPVTEKTCLGCHQAAHGKPFAFAEGEDAGRAPHPARGAGGGRRQVDGAFAAGRRTDARRAIRHGRLEGRAVVSRRALRHIQEPASTSRSGRTDARCGSPARLWHRRRRRCGTREGRARSPSAARPTTWPSAPTGRGPTSRTGWTTASRWSTWRRARWLQVIPVGDEPHGLLTDAARADALRAEHRLRRRLRHRRGHGREIEAAAGEPLALVARPVAGRHRMLVTNALSRFGGFRTAPRVRGDRARRRDGHGSATGSRGARGQPAAGRGVAPERRVRARHAQPHEEPRADDPHPPGLDDHQRPRASSGRTGASTRCCSTSRSGTSPTSTDVAFTPDGRQALVTSAGTDRVAVIDVEKLVGPARGGRPTRDRRDVLPNYLGALGGVRGQRTSASKDNPRGIAVAPDGATAWVANTLDDSVSVIDIARHEDRGAHRPRRADGGDAHPLGRAALPQRRITFQRQFACATCHPDGHVDGLTYDIEADGIGVSPVDNRTLRGIYDTAPFKWEGTNPTLAAAVRRPPGRVLHAHRSRSRPRSCRRSTTTPCTIPRPPNRYRPLGARAHRRPSAAARPSSSGTHERRPRDPAGGPLHLPATSRRSTPTGSTRDVGTQARPRPAGEVRRAPPEQHLRLGALPPQRHRQHPRGDLDACTTRDDTHGVTNDMTKDQLNDLIEYLKTL